MNWRIGEIVFWCHKQVKDLFLLVKTWVLIWIRFSWKHVVSSSIWCIIYFCRCCEYWFINFRGCICCYYLHLFDQLLWYCKYILKYYLVNCSYLKESKVHRYMYSEKAMYYIICDLKKRWFCKYFWPFHKTSTLTTSNSPLLPCTFTGPKMEGNYWLI